LLLLIGLLIYSSQASALGIGVSPNKIEFKGLFQNRTYGAEFTIYNPNNQAINIKFEVAGFDCFEFTPKKIKIESKDNAKILLTCTIKEMTNSGSYDSTIIIKPESDQKNIGIIPSAGIIVITQVIGTNSENQITIANQSKKILKINSQENNKSKINLSKLKSKEQNTLNNSTHNNQEEQETKENENEKNIQKNKNIFTQIKSTNYLIYAGILILITLITYSLLEYKIKNKPNILINKKLRIDSKLKIKSKKSIEPIKKTKTNIQLSKK